MKKKLLVLLIAASSMLMPNLASAIEIEWESMFISSVPLPPLEWDIPDEWQRPPPCIRFGYGESSGDNECN